MADDDEDDRLLAKEALHESRVLNQVNFVEDGVDDGQEVGAGLTDQPYIIALARIAGSVRGAVD